MKSVIERRINTWSEFELVDAESVIEILDSTKVKSGLNNVNVSVIQMLMQSCPEILVNVFNDCLTTGICPEVWKYTSINKILQALVKIQLDRHLKDNAIISDFQSAYRDKHSCETALNMVFDALRLKKVQKRIIVIIFLDLRRSFERELF